MLIHLNEVEKNFKTHKTIDKAHDAIYRNGWRVPEVRKRLKEGYVFSNLPHAEQFKIWDFIWNKSLNYEAMCSALYFVQNTLREKPEDRPLTKHQLTCLFKWVDRCSCWEHSDDLSKIFADLLERHPDSILPTLKKWNRSPNPWKRRQSIVSLMEYASKRKKFLSFKEMLPLIHQLLDDTHYYVQKAVGWTLRELFNAYPDLTLSYIKEQASAIKPTAFSAAIEKLSVSQKDQVKRLRKLSKVS